ncbi:MAG: histidine kinase [Bacteroidia bacterium]|nr:histidine kinase [Bacteroidia bacterium]
MLGYKSAREFFRVYAIIVFMALVAFVVRLAKFEEFGLAFQIQLIFISIFLVSVFWESLRGVHNWLNRVYPFERNMTWRIVVQLLIGSAIGIVVRSVIYYFGEPYLPFKLDALFLAATWAIYAMIPVGVNLGFFTTYFIGRWRDGLLRAERLEREKSQVQFDNLKNQLNPHFLFNALTSLNSLIFEDQKLASTFLQQLAKVYRYVLQNKERNFVSLRTELEFIQHYISLLETRFKGGLKITIDIAENLKDDRAVVPVTLQILIENAIKHNILDRDYPLHIEIFTMGEYLIVSNNLQSRALVDASNKLGLENLKSLYKFLTEKPVLIEPTESRFDVKVPLL